MIMQINPGWALLLFPCPWTTSQDHSALFLAQNPLICKRTKPPLDTHPTGADHLRTCYFGNFYCLLLSSLQLPSICSVHEWLLWSEQQTRDWTNCIPFHSPSWPGFGSYLLALKTTQNLLYLPSFPSQDSKFYFNNCLPFPFSQHMLALSLTEMHTSYADFLCITLYCIQEYSVVSEFWGHSPFMGT